ncbi:unnamed protein product [Ectocarpus sp. 13 AM-2016]
MYTRSQLMSSLAEQKDHTLRLVGKVDELAGGLGDMEELAMEYRSQMIIRQRETTEREDGMDRQTMALHHAEQEVVRLQSLLASAAEVAPQVCKAIHKVAPGFDFKERGLQPFTDARKEALEMETEQRVQELQAAAANGHEHASGRLAGSPNSARGMDSSSANANSSEGNARKGQAAAAPVVVTADAKTQAWLPADPEAAARAAVAAAALSQASDTHLSGIEPPILPKELARLDRVEWVLRRTSVAEVGTRLKAQREEEEAERDERVDGGLGRGGQGRKGCRRVGGSSGGDGSGGINIQICGVVSGGGSTGSGSLTGGVGAGADDGGKAISGTDTNGGGGAPATVSSDLSFPSPTSKAVAAVATATVAPPDPNGLSTGRSEGRTAAAPPTGAAVEDDEEDDGEEDDVADRLAGIFEFLRSGNSLLLPPDLRLDWESRPDLGLGLLAGDDHKDDVVRRFHPAPSASWSQPAAADGARSSSSPQQHRGAESVSLKSGGSSGSSYNLTGGGSGKGASTWARGLCRETSIGSGEPMTYHDLRMALTASAPKGRLSETTNDMLERRLAERRSRADEMASAMWGNHRPQCAENLYRKQS